MQNHTLLRLPLYPLTLCVALSLVTLTACSDPAAERSAEVPRPAYVTMVTSPTDSALEFVGEVRAIQRAELAFAVPGRVDSVLVEQGDRVHAGQVLATLASVPLAAQLASANGDLARSEAQLAEVTQRYSRVMASLAAGAASAAETEAIKAELASAQAAQRSAIAQRESAAWTMGNAKLRAPMDGVISARLLEPGQNAGPGTPGFSLDGAGRELSVLVPGGLKATTGQSATLRTGELQQEGKVLRIATRLEAGGLRRIFLSIPDNAEVGSTWRVGLVDKGATSVLQVPLRAVRQTEQAAGQVLRVAKDGTTVEQVSVHLGAVRGEDVDITSGLSKGDKIIVAGAVAMAPGSKIQPIAYRAKGQP